MKNRLLIVHPIIAPYRIDFINSLYDCFECEVVLWLENLQSQTFDYVEIEKQFHFKVKYMTNLYGKLKLPKGLFHEFRRFNPDIILCCEFNPITIAAIIYKKIFNRSCKIITMMDDSYDMVTGGENFSLRHILGKKILLPMLDQVICVEPRVEQFLQKKYGKGITFPIITEDNRYRERLKLVLPISEQYIKTYSLEGKKVLLFVGRLVELKNIQKIIPLFKRINNGNYVFVIVGSGPMEDMLKDMAGNDSNIIFTGRLEGQNLWAWYNVAQLFILPSYKEAFGAVTNEALLGGCYSLVSNKTGSQSLISQGINGEVFDPKSDDDILEKLNIAFEKSSTVSCPLSLRENLMQKSYHEYMHSLLTELNN